jgi:uncharacterized protein (TIGR02646 family)
MRVYRRPKPVVPTLQDTGSGGKLRKSQIDEFEQHKAVPAGFSEHWTNPDVRGALYGMQGRVCAYCGTDIEDAGIDVEHFRPKGKVLGDETHRGYWWLAYEFTNYVLSCTVCNQKLKKNRFPMVAGAERVSYDTRAGLPGEGRLLFDPTSDPIEDWLAFDWQTPAGKIVPHPALDAAATARVSQVLEFFRINFSVPHRKKRLALQKLVIDKVDANKPDEARELAIRYRPHSLVARQILADKAPASLPSPKEELEWLLRDLATDLLAKLEDIADPKHTAADEREAKELCWALAILWRDPPTETAAFVEAFLDNWKLKDLVADYHARLSVPPLV